MTRASLSTPTNAAAMMIANIILMGPADLGPAVESLDRPVLYVGAEDEDMAEQVEIMRSLRPDAHVEILEDVGHALFVDNPERFNQVLEEFLATLPGQ